MMTVRRDKRCDPRDDQDRAAEYLPHVCVPYRLVRSPDPYPVNGEEFAAKHHRDGRELRAMLRRHPDLVPGHLKHERYRIGREAESLITTHPEFKALPRR